jgi:translation elongation factor P/translation initiation factor 5A
MREIMASEVRKGFIIFYEGKYYRVSESVRTGTAQRGGYMTIYADAIIGNSKIEKKVSSDEKFQQVDVKRYTAKFMYNTDDTLVFITENNLDISVDDSVVGDKFKQKIIEAGNEKKYIIEAIDNHGEVGDVISLSLI